MPALPASRHLEPPSDSQSATDSPRQAGSDDSPFAKTCRDLLRLHECEVLAWRKRCEELEKLLMSKAHEESSMEQLALEEGDAVLKQESPGETRYAQMPVSDEYMLDDNLEETASFHSDLPPRKTLDSKASIRLSHVASNSTMVPARGSRLLQFVSSQFFEWMSCAMVVCNALVLAFESQYHGHSVGHALHYVKHATTAEEQYPHGQVTLDILSWFFGCFFALELSLRICASLRMCVNDAWAWFDAFIVIVWLISKIDLFLQVDSTVLRLARLLRLLRLLKLARAMKHFDSLYIIITATKDCVFVLFWVFITFGLVQLLLSLVLTQYLQTFYFSMIDASPEQVLVFTYYGTFLRSYFSLWEITLGNWPPAIRILAENVSEHFFTLGFIHKLVFGFAIVAIINGVFIQETFKVTARDDVIMLREKQAALKSHIQKMRRLMNHADTNNDGTISLEEWQTILQDEGVKMWLSSMDLSIYDARQVFRLCDVSCDGYLSFDELVHGVLRYKGTAKSVDLHTLRLELLQLRPEVDANVQPWPKK
eukprot:TRINITY_DN5173_c0_g2_i4.p1 TRINITY_DN5173_c0_g2~~TRINITY_DN5173_c0_g2_i4.p1  ORF type:complete len:538 (-),score=67.94 TRINITY_DN5173_c0_g2_i4:262-1875(-)